MIETSLSIRCITLINTIQSHSFILVRSSKIVLRRSTCNLFHKKHKELSSESESKSEPESESECGT